MSVSVLILTLNEERNLPRCLEALSWCDDVVVLDSFSTDRTVEIAKAHGARVIQRRFDDWSTHQNWALANIGFRHRWVYYSDADEVVPADLRDELLAVANDPTAKPVAYRLRYKNYFCGRWLRHCGIYPVWVLRFFQPDKVRWKRLVNPVAEVDGAEGRLHHHFLHYTFNNGLNAWFDKHNRYSWQEAVESLESLRSSKLSLDWSALADPVRRRRFLKELSFRMPFRPTLRFLYMYILRLGFMDGWPGYTYCRLLALYEYMIVVKMTEIRRREQGMAV
ncbi:MAG TPA: glycosyltransferase family 2 protein [Magnetospirillum sp.]|nr:glycosyltransferase family 2 protein [Magnetospirillum sp.]